VLPTQCIYVYCRDLKKTAIFFPTQHSVIGFINEMASVYCTVSPVTVKEIQFVLKGISVVLRL